MHTPFTEFEDLTEPVRTRTFEGSGDVELARRLGLPRVELYERVTSTLDVAHLLAREGAPAGTLVLAEEQTAGRGRGGRTWRSKRKTGIWLTVIERPADAAALEVLSLRVGIRAAPLLDEFAGERVLLKWPNDLLLGNAKLAGVLIETRWRGAVLDWVAIGFGINVVAPLDLSAAALAPGSDRIAVLAAIVSGIRSAASSRGPLTHTELASFANRDIASGRRCTQPMPGIVRGINAQGALLVERSGSTAVVREGSLVLEGA